MNVLQARDIMPWAINRLRAGYAIDIRSLAAFRIALGLVILVDLIRRFQHATIFYSDAGMLPRADSLSGLSIHRWSVFFSGGTPEFVRFVF